MKKEYLLYAAASVIGVVTWSVIADASGRVEAWDSTLYFSFGIPLVCLASAGFAYLEPEGSWRWASIPFAAQAVWMLSTSSLGNLFPVGLMFFAILAIPSVDHSSARTLAQERVVLSSSA